MNLQEGPKLTSEQIEHCMRGGLTPDGIPCRFLYNGQAMNITSGALASKGSNIMYHPVYWNFTKEVAQEIADTLGVKVVFSE